MIHGPPFPVSIDQLDNATLNAALGADVAGFSSERIGADRGMLGEIFLVRPDYAPGEFGPEVVICKFAALREGALASALRGGTHERELRCYDELLANTSVSTPHLYRAWYDSATAHFLLIQAAVDADGAVDQVAGILPSQAAMVAGQAARFHHDQWENHQLQELNWLPRLDDPRRINNLTTLASNGWEPMWNLVGDELSPQDRSLGDGFAERLEAALRRLATMPSTLIHCDLRADNLLFAPGGSSVSLIDWQGAGVGPASFDIAYLIANSLTVEDRRRHEADLIDGYLRQLAAAGTELSLEDFMAGYGPSLYYGLVIACALPLIGDPSEPRVKALAAAMAKRSIAALRDHGQL